MEGIVSEYEVLIEAAKTLEKAKRELTREEGCYISPAYRMVHHAQNYINDIAESVLRGVSTEAEAHA